jgi:hypothetical protein
MASHHQIPWKKSTLKMEQFPGRLTLVRDLQLTTDYKSVNQDDSYFLLGRFLDLLRFVPRS